MYSSFLARKTPIFFWVIQEQIMVDMVTKSISKYETQVACGLAAFHRCGGLAHEGLSARNRIRSSL